MQPNRRQTLRGLSSATYSKIARGIKFNHGSGRAGGLGSTQRTSCACRGLVSTRNRNDAGSFAREDARVESNAPPAQTRRLSSWLEPRSAAIAMTGSATKIFRLRPERISPALMHFACCLDCWRSNACSPKSRTTIRFGGFAKRRAIQSAMTRRSTESPASHRACASRWTSTGASLPTTHGSWKPWLPAAPTRLSSCSPSGAPRKFMRS